MANPALYVLKVGSASLGHAPLFDEIGALVGSGARVLLVAGGAAGIAEHYAACGRAMPTLELKSGDTVRYSPPAELAHIAQAYRRITLPLVRAQLARVGIEPFALAGCDSGLVTGRRNRPLRAVDGGRERIVRDHRAGVVTGVRADRLLALLAEFRVVALSPPVADESDGEPLNVDADMLAAALSLAVRADHLRLVTGTAGLLTDPADPASTLPDAHPGEAGRYAGGRMRQKVRAAELALPGAADVAITGPHSFAADAGRTRFWQVAEPAPDLTLLARAGQVPAVPGDEGPLAELLADWCRGHGVDARIDAVGNLVATRGSGRHRLLLLGHPGGGTAARAGLVSAVQALLAAPLPPHVQLRVVGAVEETPSSRGAFHARDHYPADAVVVAEPSGAGALTLGSHGVFTLRVAAVPAGCPDAVTACDAVVSAVAEIREAVLKEVPEAPSALTDLHHTPARGVAVLTFRLPPSADAAALRDLAGTLGREGVAVQVLRCTPGVAFGEDTVLARAFAGAFAAAGTRPRFLVGTGTSAMTTLATTWRGVPIVAYGPGGSAPEPAGQVAEYRRAHRVLLAAIERWTELTSR